MSDLMCEEDGLGIFLDCLAEAVKKAFIYSIEQDCAPFLGMKTALERLSLINDVEWWLAVRNLAPTVLFKTALNYEGSMYLNGGEHITLNSLPSHVKSLFPMPFKVRNNIEETLRRCEYGRG